MYRERQSLERQRSTKYFRYQSLPTALTGLLGHTGLNARSQILCVLDAESG